MKKIISYSLLTLLPALGFSEEIKPTQEELSILKEFEKYPGINKGNIKTKYLRSSESKYNLNQYELKRITLNQIKESKTFLGQIQRGVKLVDIYTGEIKYLPKDLTVYVHTVTDHQGFQYLKNKNGHLKYKVLSEKITKMKEIASLYVPTKTFSPIKKKIEVEYKDDKIELESNFKVAFGLSSSRFAQNLTGKNQPTAINARYSADTLVDMSLPFQAGALFSFENVYGNKSTSNKFQYKTLNIGPIFKTRRNKSGYSYSISATASLFSEFIETIDQSEKKFKITDRSLNLGLEKVIPTQYFGKVILGANYQRKWLVATKKGSFIESKELNDTEDSLLFHIGLQTNWSL